MTEDSVPAQTPDHRDEAPSSACPSFLAAMDVIGRRWTGVIIEGVGKGYSGFGELKAYVGQIGDTMLAKRLRELESDGLVEREVEERPLRVKYTLTPAGVALAPIMNDIIAWAHRFNVAETSLAEAVDAGA